MDSNSPVVADAYHLLQQDLFRHLEEAEYLAEKRWSDEQIEMVRCLLTELSAIVRHVLGGHRPTEGGGCRGCVPNTWPCQAVSTIHRLVKHPDYHFVRLVRGAER
jgi:hypothetical protein